MNVYEKNGKKIYYKVIVKKIKNTYFRPKQNHLLVTTNKHTKDSVIYNMIDVHFEKFHKEITRLAVKNKFTIWGNEFEIIINRKRLFSYAFVDNALIINSLLAETQAIHKVFYEEAKMAYDKIIVEMEQKLQQLYLKPVKINYRYLKSKYGSCNVRKNEITINLFLVRINPIFFKYVVCHEYAHLVVPNHQKAFYDTLNEFMINHKEIQKQLKKIAIY